MDKIIFLNVGWMSKYEGLKDDKISGGGKYVEEHGYGHEILNFQPYDGKMYGNAPVPHGTIKLEKLGAAKGAESVECVLVIWVAKSLIVGWYKNATVYRRSQPPKSSAHSFQGDPIRYHVTAAEADCTRIDPLDARWFHVPRARERKHAMGRSTWFAEGSSNSAFRAKVIQYVASGGKIVSVRKDKQPKAAGTPHQPDPFKRLKVERMAIELVTRYYTSIGYTVDSVEEDNLGWDLNVIHRLTSAILKLEVKGLSGEAVSVELTPNEYRMMQKHRDVYRVCVATKCLEENHPALAVFSYNKLSKKWLDEDGRLLRINVVESARLRV
jgi:hypothetical protein